MNAEITSYMEWLDRQREEVRQLLLGLTAEQLNWMPLPQATNSVYQLAQHIAWNELWWIGTKLAGRPFPYPWEGNEDLEGSGEDAADLLFWLDQAATTTADVLGGLEPSALDHTRTLTGSEGTNQRSVRWILVHVVEHNAEHLGQIRLTLQLYEGW
jgi:uncharacterized damage-inducible protein DinB